MNYNSMGPLRANIADVRRAVGRSTRYRVKAQRAVAEEVAALRAEVEQLSLVVTTLVAQLEASGAVTRQAIVGLMQEADGIDGLEDGRLPVAVLRELLLGEPEQDEPPANPADNPTAP